MAFLVLLIQMSTGTTLSTTVTFGPGLPAQSASSLTASPNIAAGNGSSAITLTATARDAQGNAVTGATVALSASGGNNVFGSATGATITNGTFTTTLKSTQMQTETITLTLNGNVTETASVTFTGPASATTSRLTVNPNSQSVDNSSPLTATLTLRDSSNNLLSNVSTTWTASGSNTTITPAGNTNSAGVATATYTSTFAQNENVLLASGGVNLVAPITFTAGSPNAYTSNFAAVPTRQFANNSNLILGYVTLLDSFYNPIANQTATFTASGVSTTVSAPNMTNSFGVAQGTYQSSVIQNQNAQVTIAGFNYVAPMVFTGIPSSCALTLSPNNQTANGSSPITLSATVLDSNGMAVPNIRVSFPATGSAMVAQPTGVITSPSGQAATFVTSPYAGTNTYFAQTANVQCAAQGNYTTHAGYCTGNPNYSVSTIAVGNGPRGVVACDFNSDGNQDLAVINAVDNNLSILMGFGNGTFASANLYGTGLDPLGLAVGDFNNDGIQDIVVANLNSYFVKIYLGTGTGSFHSPIMLSTDPGPYRPSVGDFDGDGNLDLITGNQLAATISVFTGLGNGFFKTQVTYPTGTSPYQVTVGDFNGDGRQDLAIVNRIPAVVGIMLGNGDSTFQAQVNHNVGVNAFSTCMGDFDGDGNQDLAVANKGSTNIGVLLGKGNATFQAQVVYTAGASATQIISGDYNGDGFQDIAVADAASSSIMIFMGSGTGTFSPQVTHYVGTAPYAFAIGDFNNDGKIDLVSANSGNNTLTVLLYNACN